MGQIEPSTEPLTILACFTAQPTTNHSSSSTATTSTQEKLLADKTRSLPTKQNQTTKTTTDSPSPSTSLLFIDQQQSMPTPTDSPVTTIETNLEESIFGIAPFNDFTWTIANSYGNIHNNTGKEEKAI
ncbi:hypothetical protein PSHT_13585 [Puccinia striiformis]|uniref:Uncharacterized protein n=1 Tax=Puccinia striiformis TaxID=27350 RepID=A0A2S4UQ49_9BASI|nr:hypothetical protein PSHT_13585 [Puccinia striiformis]